MACFARAAVLIGAVAATSAAAADPAWQRTAAVPIADGAGYELTVQQAGGGFLEVRLATDPLPATGVDQKISGASVFVPEAGDRATIVLFHSSGPYQRTLPLDGPLRWTSNGRQLCVASGPTMLACSITNGAVRYAQRIAFGAGWATEITSSPPLTVPEPRAARTWPPLLIALGIVALTIGQLRRWRRLRDLVAAMLLLAIAAWSVLAAADRWVIDPFWPCVAAGVAVSWLLVRALRTRSRQALVPSASALLACGAMLAVPHPVQLAAGARQIDGPAAPPLWIDAAYWHFHGPQQQLEFHDRPVAGVLATSDDMWLVLGGSVTAGWESDPAPAYPAVAEEELRGEGHRVRVINVGVGGWNLGQLDRFLRDVGDRLPVRGIVLASVLNNAAFPIVGAPSSPPCSAFISAYAHNLARNYLLLPIANFFVPKPHNQERFATLLEQLISRETALGRTVVLLDETHEAQLRPSWYNRWLGGPQDAYRAILRRVGARHGLALHRVDDAVGRLPPTQQFLDGMHLTPAGHVAVGTRLAGILRSYSSSANSAPPR